MGKHLTMSLENEMKRWIIELRADARKYIGVMANSYGEAMDAAADSIDSSDTDLGDWEIMNLSIEDAEQDYEEE
jgi:hypothetical protein